MLVNLCAQYDIEAIVVGAILVDGEPVSASRIRRYIEQGEVQEAARMLGRPFTIDFEVVGGQLPPSTSLCRLILYGPDLEYTPPAWRWTARSPTA